MITIMKPIDEVVKYVMDASSWSKWGDYLTGAVNVESDIIEATYYNHSPSSEEVLRWQVSLHSLGEYQLVTFTNLTKMTPGVTYIFTSGDNRAYTGVDRNSFVPIGDLSGKLLSALKAAIEKGE